jgi:hypothetical protein
MMRHSHPRRLCLRLCLCLIGCLLLPAPAAAQLVVGPGNGGAPTVYLVDGTTTRSVNVFDPSFLGGASVTLGDVNGDGTTDLIAAAGPGGGPHVRVLNGVDFTELASFFAYDATFSGGVHVAAGDVDGDGRADIITGAGAGGGPHVQVFSGAEVTTSGFFSPSDSAFYTSLLGSFLAYDPYFPGGVHVAAGDVNGDGRADIITGAGAGGGPHVEVFSGTAVTASGFFSPYDPAFYTSVLASFYAYDPYALGGVYVAAGDLNGDGRADIITGAGAGGGPHVEVFNGAAVTAAGFFSPYDAAFYTSVVASFFAYDPAFSGGVHVAAGDLNGDGRADVITGPGPGGGPHVEVFNGTLVTGAGFFSPYDPVFYTSILASFLAPVTGSGVSVGSVGDAGLRFTSAATATFTAGSAGTFTVTTAGNPAPAITSSGALPTGVTFTDNGDGTATLAGTPGAATGGTYPLTFTANNGVGPAVVQNFTLTIEQAVTFTSAAATTFTTGAAGSFTVTTTGFPVPTLTRGGVSLPTGVTFVDNGDGTGTLSGTPAAGTNGPYALTFTADNGVGAPVVQAFTLTVSGAPAFTSAATATFTVGAAGSFTVTTVATPTAALSASGTLPAGVTFADNGNGTGTLSGTPAAGTGGAYALTFTAANGVPPDGTQAFTLTVIQPPAITSAPATTFIVGTPGSFMVTTTGFPPPSLTVGGVSLPAGVTFVNNGNGTGTLSGTPAAGTAGPYAISFTATNAGGSATQPFTLTIGDVPAIDLDLDDDGGTPPTPGNDYAITFTEGSAPQFIEDEVDATITDVDSPNLTSITVTITNVLDALQEKVDVDLVTGGFSANFTKTLDESTPGIAVLTIAATPPQPLAAFNTLLRRVTYQDLDISPDTSAPRLITFVVNDGAGNSNTATTTVTIVAVDNPPTADNDSYSVDEGATLTVPAPGVLDGDVDPEGDAPITAVLATGPANASSFTLNSDGSFAYTHDGSETTTDSFTYRAVANGLQSAPATVTITITAVNDAPAITAGGTLNYTEGDPATAIDGTITVADPDNANIAFATVQIAGNYVNGQDVLEFTPAFGISRVFNPTTGTLTLSGSNPVASYQAALRTVTYRNTSATPSVAPRTVTWVVSDGAASSNTAVSTITVTSVNSAPTGGVDAWTTFGNTDLAVDQAGPATPFVADTTTSTFGVLDNDTDVEGDPRIVSGIVGCVDTTAPFVCTTTAGGSVTLESNGRFTYRPQAGDTGADSFQYVLTDVPAAGVPASVNVTVNLTLQERIWYVDGDVAGPGTGTSSDPFSALPATIGDADDFIFVHNSTVSGGITLQNGQKLYGEGFGLSIDQALNGNPAPVVLVPPGTSPTINATTGNAVGVLANTASGNLANLEIRGLTLSTTAATSNAIDVTTADAANVAVTISSVTVTGATAEGIDINQASSGTATVAISNVSVTSTGNGIDLNETAGTLTVTNFNGITVSGDTGGSGIVVANATFDATAGGAFNQVSGGTTSVGSGANPVGGAGVVLTNVSGDLAFTDLDIFSANGSGLFLTGTGAVNTGAGTGTLVSVASGVAALQSVGGPVLDITNATVNLPLNSATVTSSPTTGISLVNVAGTSPAASLSATSGSIAGTTGISVSVNGGNVSLNYGGNITQASNAAMVSVIGGHTAGTITFSGTLNATNGSGLVFDNADSTTSYNFTGTTTLNGGDAGIDILNGSSGTFTFGTATTITNPTGTAFAMSASPATVTFSGSISDNSGLAVDINGLTAGTATFQTGSITSTGSGIRVVNSTGGVINFNSPTIALTTTTNNAVNIGSGGPNTGGTINFAPAGGTGLDISTTTGLGFLAQQGGTVTVTGTGNTINATSGPAIELSGVTIGAGGVSFATTTSGGGVRNVKLTSVTGGAIALGSGALTGSTGAAFLVGDGTGAASTGGTSAITYGGSITSTGTARTVDIQDRPAGAGNITLSGTISHTTGNANVILVDTVAAGTITFSGGNSVLNGGTSTAVSLTNNSGATINFIGGGLDIDTTTGTGFLATGGGTITVQGSGNTIFANGSGTALQIANTTIATTHVTFQSISAGTASGTAGTGILLDTTGSLGGLHVTGTGSAGTGGVIQRKTGADGTSAGTGVYLNSTVDVQLAWMQLNDFDNYGIRGSQVTGFRLTNSIINGLIGNNVATPFNDGSISFIGTPTTGFGLSGSVAILDNEITGGRQRNVSIDNATGTMSLNFLGNFVHNTQPSPNGDDGFAIEVDTSAVMFANISNNTFTAHGGDHFNLSLVNNANADLTFANNDLNGGFAGALGQGLFILGASYNGTFKYDISGNDVQGNVQGGAIFVNKGSGTGTFSGRITNNVVGTPAVTGSGSAQAVGIHASARGAGGSHTTLINNNQVYQYFDRGIVLEAGEGSPALTATVTNNTVSNFADAINSLHGIHFDFGILTADNAQITVDVRNNLIANAGNEPQGGVDFRMRTAGSNDTFIAGYSGGNNSANAQTFIDSQNPDGTTFSVTQAVSGTYNNGPAVPLPTPALPTLPSAP